MRCTAGPLPPALEGDLGDSLVGVSLGEEAASAACEGIAAACRAGEGGVLLDVWGLLWLCCLPSSFEPLRQQLNKAMLFRVASRGFK